MPLITVITVVFNDEKYLEETLLSVINQTYESIEYIIIDGGSTDGTVELIKKYESQIHYWVSEPDKGIYDAMNKGIERAKGDWINFMNSGDMFFDKSVVEQLIRNLDGTFTYGHTLQFDENGFVREALGSNALHIKNAPYCHQSLFTKAHYLKCNQFDSSYQIASDYNQYVNALYNKEKFNFINMYISRSRIGGISQQDRHHNAMIREYFCILKRFNPISAIIIYCIRKSKQLVEWNKFTQR